MDWSPKSLIAYNDFNPLVPSGFLDDLDKGKKSGYENYPAWFLDITKNGVTIVKKESGMDPLVALSKACEY